MEGGTLLQLRNLINQHNISSDISGKFNAAIDLFELIVTGYILAAAMHYFQLSSLKGTPTKNVISPSVNSKDSWTTLKLVWSSSPFTREEGSGDTAILVL